MNALQCRVEEERRSIHMPINDDMLFVAMLDVEPSILPSSFINILCQLGDGKARATMAICVVTVRCYFACLIFTTSSYSTLVVRSVLPTQY